MTGTTADTDDRAAVVDHRAAEALERSGHEADDERLLEVDHLEVSFFTRRGTVQAVRDVSFDIDRSEVLGLVGESGSGKSVTAQAILGHAGPVGGCLWCIC